MLPKFLIKRITKHGRKTIPIILILALLFPLFSKPIQAFSTQNATYQFQFEQAVYKTEEMNLQSFVYETLRATVGSIVTTIIGCLSCPREEGKGGFGLIGTMSTLIAGVYATPPASGVAYLANIGERLDLVQPTYAQDQKTGFERMDVFLNIWSSFRNVTYVFFVLILVFMGFAIMFRVKISPQTVITIQSALPRIVLGLLLITFSYAVVGFLIDIMFVVSNLIIHTFRGLPDIPEILKIPAEGYAVTSDTEMAMLMFTIGWAPVIATFLIVLGVLAIPSFLFGLGGVSIPVVLGVDVIILLLVGLVFLIALIRVFWTLLRAYVMVVLSLIFAPFQILIGVLPGSNAIGSWFRNLLANLAVLPTVLAMVYLSGYLTIVSIGRSVGGGDVVLQSIITFLTATGDVTDKFQAAISAVINMGADAFSMLILVFVSVGILLLTPRAADIIQSFIRGRPFEYGAAIGEAVGYPGRMVGYGIRGAAILTDIGTAWTTRFGFREPKAGAEPGRPRGEVPPLPEQG